jgi:hypothetical protein
VWECCALHESFGKCFGVFQPGCCLSWSKDGQSGSLEGIDYAKRQWIVGADHREIDFVLLGEGDQSGHVFITDGDVGADFGRARIARGDKNTAHSR